MTLARLDWQQHSPLHEKPLHESELAAQYHPVFLEICMQRGIETVEDFQRFVSDAPSLFHDPMLLYDMEKSVQRIEQALSEGEQILVFGDYDADGITSTTILVETLENLGAQVHYYLPDRFKEGYGPNEQVFDYYIKEGITLIITVDCGIAAHQAVSFAMEQGVDVIVTDHHEIPSELPNAFSIVHPRHPLGNYPFGDLSGAGVAFKLATALLGEIPYELMDVAAIGTVADLVSLTDENRTIVKHGLALLQQPQRIGLIELFEQLSISPETVSATTIGFMIGPRFNALGRLGDASPGVELLLTFSHDEAQQIVTLMDEKNKERQAIVERIVAEAVKQIDHQQHNLVHVLHGEDWHEGVLGIVASKIVELTKRPTIILTKTHEQGVIKGSARSVQAVNIYTALQECDEVLLKYGGHHMAAGLSLKEEQLHDFIEKINQYTENIRSNIESEQPILIDATVSLKEVTIDFIEQLQLLEPFGTDNEEPIIAMLDVVLKQAKQIGAQQQHLKAVITDETNEIQVIGFHKGIWIQQLMNEATISIIGTLSINEWQGNRLPQLQMIDIRKEARQYFDWRTSKLRNEHFQVNDAIYVTNTSAGKEYIQTKIPSSSIVFMWEEIDEKLLQETTKKAMVIVDCPINRTVTEKVINMSHELDVYIIAYTSQRIMTNGMPTREQFKTVYQYLRKHNRIALHDKLPELATYLSINEALLKFILNVFVEATFITLEQGVVIVHPNPTSINLEETILMEKRRDQLWLEKVFVYSNFNDLVKWLS